MFHWEQDGIRFMKDASEHASYNQELAALIAPYFTKESHICDAGCGLGYLSLALAPCVGKVTSVDADAGALAVLQENCREKKIDNIEVLCGDAMRMAPEQPYDGMVFCFFANMDEMLEIVKEQCRGTVIAIKKNYSSHRFSVGTHAFQHDSFDRATARLTELGIPFEAKTLELEFGQPFRSFKDVRLFYEIYSKDEEKNVITDEFLKDKIRETGDDEFPYYMPHLRKLGWIKFETKDIK